MRIAIVGNPYYPVPPKKYGGTERVIFNLIQGLLERGHEPILLAPADSEVDCRVIPIAAKSMPFPRKNTLAFRRKVKRATKTTKEELLKLAPEVDIIHSHDFDLKDFAKFPNLTTIHGHIDFNNMSYYQDRKDLYYATISENQQATFPGLNYVGVAYNGLDPADFPINLKPKDYLCFLGRFDWDKSPHYAIQLALSLGLKIKLAGKLDLEGGDYFKKFIKPYLKNPLVEYLGEVNSSERIKLVSNALCNLHPLFGRREPFGLTVIEAAYCGTPSIAMNRASMPELIRNGRTGILVEDFVEGYWQVDNALKLDRQYVADWARKKFNYQKMTRNYLKAYRNVIKEYK